MENATFQLILLFFLLLLPLVTFEGHSLNWWFDTKNSASRKSGNMSWVLQLRAGQVFQTSWKRYNLKDKTNAQVSVSLMKFNASHEHTHY